MFSQLIYFLLVCLPSLISVAFLVLLERKVLSLVGLRLGPSKVSFLGILQSVGDALKLANKSVNSLSSVSLSFYYISSLMMMLVGLILFLCVNISPPPIQIKVSLLFFLLVLSFNSLNSILVGWSAYSKFSLIGSIRSVSQLVSYEGVMYRCIFFLITFYASFNMASFSFFPLLFLFFFLLPCFFLWVPSMLAELNRTPYDFSEGESELVSGFNTEFGSGCFTLIFLAEYSSMVFFCILSSFLFFSPAYFFFFFFFFFLIWARSVLPRFRFDKLMHLAWKFFIPFLTIFYLIFIVFFF